MVGRKGLRPSSKFKNCKGNKKTVVKKGRIFDSEDSYEEEEFPIQIDPPVTPSFIGKPNVDPSTVYNASNNSVKHTTEQLPVYAEMEAVQFHETQTTANYPYPYNAQENRIYNMGAPNNELQQTPRSASTFVSLMQGNHETTTPTGYSLPQRFEPLFAGNKPHVPSSLIGPQPIQQQAPTTSHYLPPPAIPVSAVGFPTAHSSINRNAQAVEFVTQAPQQITTPASFQERLSSSSILNRCDIYNTGLTCYHEMNRGIDINSDVQSFANAHSNNCPVPIMKVNGRQRDGETAYILELGNFVYNSLLRANLEKMRRDMRMTYSPAVLLLEDVRGHKVFVSNEYKIRADPPFIDYIIDVAKFKSHPPSQEKSHIVLLKYLIAGLVEICEPPEAIRMFTKTGSSFGSGTYKELPSHVYEAFYGYFLEFFQLQHEELEDGHTQRVQQQDWYLKLGLNEEERSYKFVKLSAGRRNYTELVFEEQLKTALSEIRLGSFTVDEFGNSKWIKRRRYKKTQMGAEATPATT